jgi:hypothetical protein
VIDSQRDTDNRLLVERLEGLGAALRLELQGMIPSTPEPDYQAIAQVVTPLLAPALGEALNTRDASITALRAEMAALGEALNTRDALIAAPHTEMVTLKEQAIGRKAAGKETTRAEEIEGQSEGSTDEGAAVSIEESSEESAGKAPGKERISGVKSERHLGLSEEANMVALHYENALSWLTASGTTVSLKMVSESLNVSMKLLRNRVESKRIRATRNKEVVYKESVIEWAIVELISKESAKIVHLRAVRNEEDAGVESSG